MIGPLASTVGYAAHLVLSVAGSLGFAAAGVAGAWYLRTYRRLRRRDPALLARSGPSLERLAGFIRTALPVGWVLLTAAIVTGFVEAVARSRGGWFRTWQTHPKLLAASVAWLTAGAALVLARAKRFRGRQLAALSLVVFFLLLGVFLGSFLIP